jgi:hypothetical protein
MIALPRSLRRWWLPLCVLLASPLVHAEPDPPKIETHPAILILGEAILKQRVVTVVYGGLEYEIEPHALGVSREGRVLLRAFSRTPVPDRDRVPNWMLLRVDRLSEMRVYAETFPEPRPGYRRGDRAMMQILVEL